MAITRDEYADLRARGVSHEDIVAGNYDKGGFFANVIKEPIESLIVKPGARLGQAIAAAGVKAFGTEEMKARLPGAIEKQRTVPSIGGGFTVEGLRPGAAGARQVVGEAVQSAVNIASSAYAPAVKPGLGFLRGAWQGAKAAAPATAGFGAGGELGRSIERGRGVGETIGRTVAAGVSAGVAGGILGGVVGGVTGRMAYNAARRQELIKIFQDNPQDSRVAQYAKVGATKILGRDKLVSDPLAKAAIDSGIDNANVAVFKGASKTDKTAFGKMLDIFEKGKTDAKYRALNRPSDVVGEPVIAQAKTLLSTLKTQGKMLDDVAAGLKDNFVDVPISKLDDDLARAGIGISDNGKLDFTGSDFEGLPTVGTIERVYRRIKASRDALDVHRAKRYIDTLVEYGKQADGLPGYAERMLKGWRRAMDAALDSQYPAYNKVNKKISTAFDGLDALGDLAGTRFKATDELAAAKIGQIARGILSNSRNRTDLLTRLNDVQKAAAKLGYKAKDDIVSRVLFFDEMERLFGTQAPTGFQGQATRAIEHAVDTGKVVRSAKSGGITGGILAVGEKAASLLKSDPQARALAALRALVGN